MKLTSSLTKKVALQIKTKGYTRWCRRWYDHPWFVEGKNEWKKKSLETFRFCDFTGVPQETVCPLFSHRVVTDAERDIWRTSCRKSFGVRRFLSNSKAKAYDNDFSYLKLQKVNLTLLCFIVQNLRMRKTVHRFVSVSGRKVKKLWSVWTHP